jgi:hypothetical protein
MAEINSERERFEALAERYRSEAKVCRDFAHKARHPHDKAAWLRLAEDWNALAEQAESTPLRHPASTLKLLHDLGTALGTAVRSTWNLFSIPKS